MQLPVHVQLGADMGNLMGITRDISTDGVYFYVTSELGERAEIDFVVTFPPEITMVTPVKVKCTGEIIRKDRNTMRGTGVATAIKRYEFINVADSGHA